jgi:Uma2 family endonuclease
MSTAAAPRIITPDEFYRMGDAAKGFELVNGEMKELGMSARSCRVGGKVYHQFENHSLQHNSGWAFPPETGYRCFAADRSLVRKPDASFIALNRMTREQYEEEGYIDIVPDLVVEVISPNDRAADVEEKLAEWLGAGVKVVWIINPESRTIRIHRRDGESAFLRSSDTLSAHDVLPGFSLPVAELFRVPGEPAASP